MYGWRFPQKLKGALYGSTVRLTILYGSEAWCPKESEMGIRKRSTELMFMLGLNETIDLLAVASNVC